MSRKRNINNQDDNIEMEEVPQDSQVSTGYGDEFDPELDVRVIN